MASYSGLAKRSTASEAVAYSLDRARNSLKDTVESASSREDRPGRGSRCPSGKDWESNSIHRKPWRAKGRAMGGLFSLSAHVDGGKNLQVGNNSKKRIKPHRKHLPESLARASEGREIVAYDGGAVGKQWRSPNPGVTDFNCATRAHSTSQPSVSPFDVAHLIY